jgi:transaldolase
MSKEFFLDTANEEELRRVWDFVNKQSEIACLGITTNPNALAKIGCNTMAQFETVIPSLVSLTTEMTDGRGGIVHVQIPNSMMEDKEIIRWATYVAGFSDGVTAMALKIPHQTRTLRLASTINGRGLMVNVTGISDWATLCKAFQYPYVKYASLIPGRMEEVGIDANLHMDYIRQIDRAKGNQQVIAGSMRTIDGLHSAIARGTIPTIGMRVWNELLKPSMKTGRHAVTNFTRLWDEKRWGPQVREGANAADFSHAPLVTATNIQLSVDFFDQMDKLGQDMYQEFIL